MKIHALNKSQRGVAALEFALIFSVIFLILYGLLTFSIFFLSQQAASRAAEDAARATNLRNVDGSSLSDAQIIDIAYSALAESSFLIVGSCDSFADKKSCLQSAQSGISVTPITNGKSKTISIKVPYASNPMLAILPPMIFPLLGGNTNMATADWTPPFIAASATAAL